jgi:ParB-like chromosome segregation protein Spo0J
LINETPNSDSNKKTSTPEKSNTSNMTHHNACNGQFKAIQEKTVSGEKVYIIGDVDDDSGRSLAESIQNLGPIAPIYYMSDGVTLVDGFHRLAEAPNAHYTKIILKDCDTEVKRIIYDLTLNCNRRKATPEELRQKITVLATEGHLSVKEITDKIGLGYSTVDRYFPKPLKQPGHSLSGIASGKARALNAEKIEAERAKQRQLATLKQGDNVPLLPIGSNGDSEDRNENTAVAIAAKKDPEAFNDNFIPSKEQTQSQNIPTRLGNRYNSEEPTAEEKADALIAEADREQQQLEKLIHDAKAEFPDDFKKAVYNLAFNPARELTEKRFNECLTVTLEVLLDFIEQEGTMQELLKTASEKW